MRAWLNSAALPAANGWTYSPTTTVWSSTILRYMSMCPVPSSVMLWVTMTSVHPAYSRQISRSCCASGWLWTSDSGSVRMLLSQPPTAQLMLKICRLPVMQMPSVVDWNVPPSVFTGMRYVATGASIPSSGSRRPRRLGRPSSSGRL